MASRTVRTCDRCKREIGSHEQYAHIALRLWSGCVLQEGDEHGVEMCVECLDVVWKDKFGTKPPKNWLETRS